MKNLLRNELLSGRYRVVRLIGEGSMGHVYEAEHVHIRRRVAIKVLQAKFSDDEAIVERFIRESRAAAQIGSRHIVEVLDVGALDSGQRYIVMEFLEGESLRTCMRRKTRMTAQEIFPLMVQLLNGLHAAHGAGVLHRDVKPDNVFLVKQGATTFVKLLDFGISKFHFEDGELTSTGTVMGTPRYMAPEQALGERDMDRRADLFSVGAVMFKALSDKYAFEADSPSKLLFKTALTAARPLSSVAPDIAKDVCALVDKSLQREPKDRFQHAVAMAQALGDWLAEQGQPLDTAAAWYRDAPIPDFVSTPSAIADDATAGQPLDELEMGSLAGQLATEVTAMTAAAPVPRARKRWPLAALLAVGLGVAMLAYTTWLPTEAPDIAPASTRPEELPEGVGPAPPISAPTLSGSAAASAASREASASAAAAGPVPGGAAAKAADPAASAAASAAAAAATSAMPSRPPAPPPAQLRRYPHPKPKPPRLSDERLFRPEL